MSSPTDPIRLLRRRIALTWSIGSMLVIACALWAFRIPEPSSIDVEEVLIRQPGQHSQPGRANPALDQAAFTAMLWNPPPALEVPPSPTPQHEQPAARETINLQLIGITTENGQRIAALYDPQADTLHLVAGGESIGRLRVTSITDAYVELDDGRGPRRIELTSAPRSPRSTPGRRERSSR